MTGGVTTPAVTVERDAPSAVEPTRDVRATLPDLLDVLLDKGVFLDLDLIVTVAKIPLIGVSLRAMVAGIETMLDHGMMQAWDEQTREWVRRSLSERVALADGEDVLVRMAGGHRQGAPYGGWRPGTIYLTTRRLMVWRAEPRELLWQASLDEITAAVVQAERSVGGEERGRVAVTTPAGTTLLSAAAPERLQARLGELVGGSGPGVASGDGPLIRERVWYLEELAGGSVWRVGTGALGRDDGLTWKGSGDARPAVRLRPSEIRSVDVVEGDTPAGQHVLVVQGNTVTIRLATAETERWATVFTEVTRRHTLPRTEGAT